MLPEAYSVYANAYLALDAEREYTSPIPWSVIVTYCEYYGFDSEQTEWVVAITRSIDEVILEKRRKEVKRHG